MTDDVSEPFTGLQLTRLQRDPDKWLVRAWHDGHGCDVIVDELDPPYTTYPGEGRLAVADASGATIASTVWKITPPAKGFELGEVGDWAPRWPS